MANGKFDTFISYRRVGGDTVALLLKANLEKKRRRVFLDVANLPSGRFDESLSRSIEAAPNFLIVLSPNSLDRCSEEQDWLRKEIADAIRTSRNIVPVLMPGFVFPNNLPPDIEKLRTFHGVEYSLHHSESTMNQIGELLTQVRRPWLAIGFFSIIMLFPAVIAINVFTSKVQPPPNPNPAKNIMPLPPGVDKTPKPHEASSTKPLPTSLLKVSHDSNLETAQWYLDRKMLRQRPDSNMLVSYFNVAFGRHSLKVVGESTCEFTIEINAAKQEERVRCPE